MVRSLFACLCLLAVVAPGLAAQQKVCVFQQKKDDAKIPNDAAAEAKELNAHSVQALAATGVSPHDEDAAAGERGCTWIVTVKREPPPPESPVFGEAGPGSDAAELTRIRNAGTYDLIDFSLRKPGNRKAAAKGYSQDASAYAKIAAQILKKLDKEK